MQELNVAYNSRPLTPGRAGGQSAIILVFILLSLLTLRGENGSEPIQVTVSIAPQAFFADKIGGRLVKTEYLIPAGASPAAYAPTPRQLIKAVNSDIYLKLGHPHFLFEKIHIDPILANRPGLQVISMWGSPDGGDLAGGQAKILPAASVGNDDPHIWMAPDNVRRAVRMIAAGLIELDPAHESEYLRNLKQFIREIDQLDSAISVMLKDSVNRKFMVFHPILGYFADQYGLEQIAIEHEGKEPGPARIIELIAKVQSERIKVIFTQQGFSKRGAEVIARETGATIVALEPLRYDWLANMYQIAGMIKSGLSDE